MTCDTCGGTRRVPTYHSGRPDSTPCWRVGCQSTPEPGTLTRTASRGDDGHEIDAGGLVDAVQITLHRTGDLWRAAAVVRGALLEAAHPTRRGALELLESATVRP